MLLDQEANIFRLLFLNKQKQKERFSKLLSVNNFQKLKSCVLVFTAKTSDIIIFTSNLDNKLNT